MPSKSEAQRRFIYGAKGAQFAKEHHFDNKGKLPPKVGGKAALGVLLTKKKKKSKKGM